MYLLDTNVISELRKKNSGRADPAVVRWANSVVATELFLPVVAIFEIEMGLLKISPRNDEHSRRLKSWLSDSVMPAFAARILPIDENVALIFAGMMVSRTRPYRDALIAATARHHGYTVVTRNIRNFEDLQVKLINPWEFS